MMAHARHLLTTIRELHKSYSRYWVAAPELSQNTHSAQDAMAEAAHALSILSKEVSITDEVLDALSRCKSGTTLNAEARGVIKQALAVLQGEEVKLAKAHETLTAHQRLHLKVEGLRRQVRAEERRIQDCARRLTEADAVLRGPLQDAKRLLEIGRQAEAAEIDVREVVDYAQRISGITSAPSYWKPGMAMVGFAPPAPRPEMMRAGALSAFSDAVGNSVPSDELMKLVQDLDRPPQKNPEENGGASIDSGGDNGNRSNFKGREGREEKRSKGDTMRTAEDDEGNASDKSGVGVSSSNFGRQDTPKRPKILLDLDDLDSDSEEDDD